MTNRRRSLCLRPCNRRSPSEPRHSLPRKRGLTAMVAQAAEMLPQRMPRNPVDAMAAQQSAYYGQQLTFGGS